MDEILFSQSPLSTMIYGMDGRPLRVNAAFTRFWGLTLADLQPGYCIFEDPQLYERGLVPLVRQAFAGTATWLPPFSYDALPLSADGRVRYAKAFLYPLTGADGQACQVVLTHYEVTDEVEAEQALRASEARYRRAEALARGQLEALTRTVAHLADAPNLDALLGHVLYEIIQQVEASAGYIFVHDAAAHTLSLHTSVRNGEIAHGPQPDDPPLFQRPISADRAPAVERLYNARTVQRVTVADAARSWPELEEWLREHGDREVASQTLLAGDQLVGLLGLTFRAGPPLTDTGAQLIQTLGQQAALAIQLTRLSQDARRLAMLEERTRLAREIHDTLAQGFIGIIVQLQAAAEIAPANPVRQQAHLEQAISLAKASLAEARRSVRALRAPALVDTDLSGALLRLMQQSTAQTAVTATFAVSGTPVPLHPDVEGQLLRIGQEAMANALKHAQAQQLAIELDFAPTGVQLEVRDDGVGFVPGPAQDGHYGLIGLRERAQQLGATLKVLSAPGQGTTIRVVVPPAAGEGARNMQ
jgi:signal transduction histidine kinase